MDARSETTVEAVLETVARCAPEIRSALPGRRVESSETNPSGEVRMAADAYADDLLKERLGAIDGVGEYASEERAGVVETGEGLSVGVDPLGSSSRATPSATCWSVPAGGPRTASVPYWRSNRPTSTSGRRSTSARRG